MIRSVAAPIPLHTVWFARQTVLIWPILPLFIRASDTLLPDLLAPHHVLAAQVCAIVFDPLGDGLACIGLDL